MSLKHLNNLNISHNYIKDIRPLEYLELPMIKSIILNNNLYIITQQKNIDIINNIREKSRNIHYF